MNYFDSSINVQLSFLNQVADVEEFHSQLEIDGQDDEFNDIRQEYTEMLKNKLAKGNNGLVKTKYITFGVDGNKICHVISIDGEIMRFPSEVPDFLHISENNSLNLTAENRINSLFAKNLSLLN